MPEKIIEFLRKKDYKLIEELGQGACGKTVLLHDSEIDEHFACKKYVPYSETQRKDLFANFVREIKLLHQVYHPNVVRVFNYYLYPNEFAGYILMEYVRGVDIEEYLKGAPEKINELFLQAIAGFLYLEENNILHRDIRVGNLLVRADGVLKIIDLGFGKYVQQSTDFDKSISLNWWCEKPKEFESTQYSFKTELYFVGKLFAYIIQENDIEHFAYHGLLSRMCHRDPQIRIESFFEINKEIQSNKFFEIDFDENELNCYRSFAHHLGAIVTKIAHGTKYRDDIDKVQAHLDELYRKVMLEEFVPAPTFVCRCFITGEYYSKTGYKFPVDSLREFLHLFKSSTLEKRRIILSNIHTKLDSIARYTVDDDEDEIPF